jgi:transcriptional regulator with XRE-family HTH domain
MKVTNETIELIKRRFRDPTKPKINQSQLADHMGYGKAWVSKLMNKKLQNLTEEQVELLEKFLSIKLQEFSEVSKMPPLAAELARKMQTSEPLTRIVSALLEIEPAIAPSTRWIETKDMTKVGQEIIRLVFANEDKPGKVAREVLKLLA